MSESDDNKLGRGVIVGPGSDPPPGWADARRIAVGPGCEVIGSSDALDAVDALAEAWSAREPLVVELGIDPTLLRTASTVGDPVWSLDPGLVLTDDRLHFLIWANNYDAREGDPIWWWSRKAAAFGAEAHDPADGPGDIRLDGSPAWIDGGPRWTAPGDAGLPVVHAESIESGRVEAISPGPADQAGVGLAPDQLAAVRHIGGPLRVIAPAGSGKTRVLTERLRFLLGERGYTRDGLCAVAYNKEAQREMESRLSELAPRTQTINSLGYELLGNHRGGRPRVLQDAEVREIVERVFPMPRQRRANTDPVGPYLDALTQVRLGLVDPAIVEEMRDDVPGLAEGFNRYREALIAAGGIDWDEQIYSAVEALLRDGSFRRTVQPRYRHLLVDEFQDLTPAHLLMLRLLAMPALDVFGVGDDDQTIYEHAGADPRFLIDYADFFPGAETAALTVNYRCPVATVEGVDDLLAYNRVRVPKEIHAAPDASEDMRALRVTTHEPEVGAERLVEVVRGWLRPGGDPDGPSQEPVRPDEVAVLTRVNSLLLAPQVALMAAGIPHDSPLSETVLERTGMAAALAWIRVGVDPEGLIPSDLMTIGRRPSRGFPRWIQKWLVNCRSVEDLRAAAERIDDHRVSERLGELADDIELVADAASRGGTTREVLEVVRTQIGLDTAMEKLDTSKGSEAAGGHIDDLEALVQVASLEPDPGEFEPWLRALLADEGSSGGVRLATVHKVKGREWPRVIVFGATDRILPHRLATDAEGERRVLHVAVTRGIEQTVVLGDSSRPSPFLDELTGAAPPPAERDPVETIKQVEARTGALPGGRNPGTGSGRRGAAPPKPGIDLSSDGQRLAEALKEWRKRRSDADSVPAYVVLSNRHVEAIAAAAPSDEAELLRCEGIGPTRLERYGDEILAVLAEARS